MKCLNCGAEILQGVPFCGECGSKIEPNQTSKFCTECGAAITPGVKFCNNCGNPVITQQPKFTTNFSSNYSQSNSNELEKSTLDYSNPINVNTCKINNNKIPANSVEMGIFHKVIDWILVVIFIVCMIGLSDYELPTILMLTNAAAVMPIKSILNIWSELGKKCLLKRGLIIFAMFVLALVLATSSNNNRNKNAKYIEEDMIDITYKVSENWEAKKATSPDGMYYYPNSDNTLIYLCHQDTPESVKTIDANSFSKYEYNNCVNAILNGFVSGDDKKIVSTEMLTLNSYNVTKANLYKDINGFETEVDAYIYITYDYIYSIIFAQRNELSPEMKEIEEEFIKNLTLKKQDLLTENKAQQNNYTREVQSYKPVEEHKATTKTESASKKSLTSYQAIYDEYSKKIKDAAPSLADEYKKEAASLTDLMDKANLSNKKVSELAEISNEGVGKMAEYMYESGGSYSDYESWSGKLLDIYMDEADKIMDEYMNSGL